MAVPSETEAFDFVGSPPPSRFYVACSTPRSGSTLLTRLLWRSGRMGAPHEYFKPAETLVADWIRQAKRLPRVVKY